MRWVITINDRRAAAARRFLGNESNPAAAAAAASTRPPMQLAPVRVCVCTPATSTIRQRTAGARANVYVQQSVIHRSTDRGRAGEGRGGAKRRKRNFGKQFWRRPRKKRSNETRGRKRQFFHSFFTGRPIYCTPEVVVMSSLCSDYMYCILIVRYSEWYTTDWT